MKNKKIVAIAAISLFCLQLNAQDTQVTDLNTSNPCQQPTTTWFLGGNMISLPANYSSPLNGNSLSGSLQNQNLLGSEIGTCNDVPFILKAKNINSVFVMPSGRVGIGVYNPAAILEVAGPSNSEVFCSSAAANAQSGFWARTNSNSSQNSFGFVSDGANNIGRIKSNSGGSINDIMSYKFNQTLGQPQVWIGKVNPTTAIQEQPTGIYNDYVLGIGGKLVAKSIYVEVSNWADFVFEPQFKLRPLSEVRNYIEQNKHLPDVPSAKDVEENGIGVAEMNKVLLQKVEELTLYILDQEAKQKQLETKLIELEKNIK